MASHIAQSGSYFHFGNNCRNVQNDVVEMARKTRKARRIASFSDMKKTPILDSAGVPHETTPLLQARNAYRIGARGSWQKTCVIVLSYCRRVSSAPKLRRRKGYM